MNAYNILGTVNTIFISISVYGVYLQLKTVWKNKENQQVLSSKGKATAVLSLNQIFVSFLAYFSFFIYGYSIEPFNHFIVWPRLFATVIVATLLYEIWRDRKDHLSLTIFTLASAILCLGLIGGVFGASYQDESKTISTILMLVISALIAQGYYHQFILILKSGQTGAVNLRTSQFIFAMDISTIAFAISMGLRLGWPLLVLAITSALTKIIMMYLFYWSKHSVIAAERRMQSS